MENPRGQDQKIRLFTGIPIPEDFSAYFEKIRSRNTAVEGLKWVPLQNLHITVSFIGDTSMERLEFFQKQTEILTDNISPFQLNFQEVNFHRSHRPYMIWGKFFKNESFKDLILLSTKLLDLEAQSHKRINPHVTLARFKAVKNIEAIDFSPRIDNPILEVKRLVLWESKLTSLGAEYVPIKEFRLLKKQ